MSTSLQALLEGPVGVALTVRVKPDSPREIIQATLLEDFTYTDALRTGAIAVLSRSTGTKAGAYQFDVLVRQAVEREVAVLVLRSNTRRSITAESLAARGRLAIVQVENDTDPLQVLDWLGAAVSGDSRATLARIAAAAAYQPGNIGSSTMLDELSQLTGIELTYLPETVGFTEHVGFSVQVDGRPAGSVISPERGDAAAVACQLAASILTRELTNRDRAVMQPARSTSGSLSQLLLCSQANLAAVSERAVEAGLHIDGRHHVVRLAVGMAHGSNEDDISQIEHDLILAVAHRPSNTRTAWTVARPDASIVLVRTTRSGPGRQADEPIRPALDELIAEVLSKHPGTTLRIGIATAHEGASGLRASAEEARIALASALISQDPISVATFDSLGIRRMLAEWLTSDTARDTVTELLAPLDALGPEKAWIAIQTLHAYLDERGSLIRTAERLNIHRNAVVYRMAQITDKLPNDLADPDQRFALQLACRARTMTGRPPVNR